MSMIHAQKEDIQDEKYEKACLLICGKMFGPNSGPRKYVHRKDMLYKVRRLGSSPGFAIPGCMILDRSLINLGLHEFGGD